MVKNDKNLPILRLFLSNYKQKSKDLKVGVYIRLDCLSLAFFIDVSSYQKLTSSRSRYRCRIL